MKKAWEKLFCTLFNIKCVEFVNIARILRDQNIASLPTVSVKFPIPMVTYKLGLTLSSKILDFNQFVNTLDLCFFIKSNCNGSCYVDKHQEHIVTNDLLIIF